MCVTLFSSFQNEMVTKKVLSYLLSRTLGPNAALKHIFHPCSACYATTSDHPFSQSQLRTSTKVVLPSFPCQQWKTRRGFEMCVTILNNNASVCSGIVPLPVSWHLSRNYSTKKDKKSKGTRTVTGNILFWKFTHRNQ